MTSADQNQLIAWAVAGTSFVLNVALVVKQLLSKNSPTPQPLVVKQEDDFVKKEDFEKLERKIDEVDRRRSVGVAGAHAKVDAMDTGVQTELRLMNARISETEVTLSALDERTKTTNHTVDSISAKVDTLLSRSRNL